MKKIPDGSEAANVLVGEVDYLEERVAAFIRLRESVNLGKYLINFLVYNNCVKVSALMYLRVD